MVFAFFLLLPLVLWFYRSPLTFAFTCVLSCVWGLMSLGLLFEAAIFTLHALTAALIMLTFYGFQCFTFTNAQVGVGLCLYVVLCVGVSSVCFLCYGVMMFSVPVAFHAPLSNVRWVTFWSSPCIVSSLTVSVACVGSFVQNVL